MLNLAEYRKKPQSLADFLPWAALVAEGVELVHRQLGHPSEKIAWHRLGLLPLTPLAGA